MIGILLFAIAILINVAFHEFGHMFVAKLVGMEVPEYAIGFGPTLWKKEKKGTTYLLKAIPLGGYCRIIGLEGEHDAKSSIKHIPVLLAGVFCNFILFIVGITIYSHVLLNTVPPTVIITNTTENAIELGFKQHDEILSVNGSTSVHKELNKDLELYEFDLNREGNPLSIKVYKSQYKDGKIGISYSGGKYSADSVLKMSYIIATDFLLAIPEILTNVGESIVSAFNIQSDYDINDGITVVSGAKYVYGQAETLPNYNILEEFMKLSISISFSLMVFNLIPIPALDGGRLLLVIIDLITRNKISRKIQNSVIIASNIALLGLMSILIIIEIVRL